MNITVLKGRLVRDVELKYTQSQMAIAKFSIAVNDNYKDKKKVYFFNITAFGKSGEFVDKYFSKGKEILVDGRLVQNRYTDKNGVNKSSIEIIANSVDFCGFNKDSKDTEPDIKKDTKQDIEDENMFLAETADDEGEVPF